jgi:hypothetical protein
LHPQRVSAYVDLPSKAISSNRITTPEHCYR